MLTVCYMLTVLIVQSLTLLWNVLEAEGVAIYLDSIKAVEDLSL